MSSFWKQMNNFTLPNLKINDHKKNIGKTNNTCKHNKTHYIKLKTIFGHLNEMAKDDWSDSDLLTMKALSNGIRFSMSSA